MLPRKLGNKCHTFQSQCTLQVGCTLSCWKENGQFLIEGWKGTASRSYYLFNLTEPYCDQCLSYRTHEEAAVCVNWEWTCDALLLTWLEHVGNKDACPYFTPCHVILGDVRILHVYVTIFIYIVLFHLYNFKNISSMYYFKRKIRAPTMHSINTCSCI